MGNPDIAPGSSKGAPSVAIVVPARNESARIGACLASIRAAAIEAARNFEVVVVDDDSSDQTGVLAQEQGARVVTQRPRRGPLAAWAKGVEVTSAPLIVFVDADCVVAMSALRAVLSPFADERVGVVAARPVPGPAKEHPGLVERSAHFSAIVLHEVKRRLVDHDFLPVGRLMAVRRSAWGVTDVELGACDRVVAHAAKVKGWRIVYRPDAVVRYQPPLAFPELEADFRRTRAPLGFDADPLPKSVTLEAMVAALVASPIDGVAWLLCQLRLSRSARGSHGQLQAPASWDAVRRPSGEDEGRST